VAYPRLRATYISMCRGTAAGEFYDKNKDSIDWDMVIFNPPYVYGVLLHSFHYFWTLSDI
jgi:hypothetical protein